MSKVPWCWYGLEGNCDPDQAGFSASLIKAVSGPERLDWSRHCVPLTRGLRIPWGILCGSLGVSPKLLFKRGCKHVPSHQQ